MIANTSDLMKLNQNNLPASSITVFIIEFIMEEIQNNNKFKNIKIITNKFIKKGDIRRKFSIKCRYLKSDERIDKKIIKIRKNSSIMITGELILINSEFQVDIQDLNFLPMSMTSIESINTDNNNDSNEVSNKVNDEINDENITNPSPNTQKYIHKRKRTKK